MIYDLEFFDYLYDDFKAALGASLRDIIDSLTLSGSNGNFSLIVFDSSMADCWDRSMLLDVNW